MEIVGWLFIALFVLISLLALWRFLGLRAQGTQVLIRRMPSRDTRGWRHGVIRYRGDLLDFYQLRSVSPKPDVTFERSGFALKGRREQTTFEQRFMESNRRILVVETKRGEFEWAVDSHTEMALLAWVESAPTQPLQRMDVKTAQKYFKDK
ncbi:hypothetical protein CKALI_04550 [Corynebacterium kalinowskii]|uniref:DUF2550 domain-containing protein n=1 Tax=Corynebacterium kalinowskii TaxID=2675216 RepID=A0A6B8W2C1_9CORY|nr:DUF2550 domain-containing protein [Corynebacterium kalinowskii]QGU01788.1 hypothetical protein CKALI_04550 [Corynebacterium kalinowskii]